MDFSVLFGIGLIVRHAIAVAGNSRAGFFHARTGNGSDISRGARHPVPGRYIYLVGADSGRHRACAQSLILTIKLYQRLSAPSAAGDHGGNISGRHERCGDRRRTILTTSRGKVAIENDTWSATSESLIIKGKNVVVVSSEGVHVVVKEI